MGPGMAGGGGEQQAHILPLTPDVEQKLIPSGLVELVDFASDEAPAELRRHGGEAQGV